MSLALRDVALLRLYPAGPSIPGDWSFDSKDCHPNPADWGTLP